jgi:hypothetical protein
MEIRVHCVHVWKHNNEIPLCNTYILIKMKKEQIKYSYGQN